MIHVLKAWPEPFRAMWSGDKTAEFRRDDRQFQVGDWLELTEYDPDRESLSGREIIAQITDIRRGPVFGIPEGYAMLSVARYQGLDTGGVAWQCGDGRDFRADRIESETRS